MRARASYVVIHPLDDAPEQKRNPHTAGRLRLTWTMIAALWALRAYLVAITLLVAYRVYVLARGGQ